MQQMGKKANIYVIGVRVPQETNSKNGLKDRTLTLLPAVRKYMIKHLERPCPRKSGYKWPTLPNASY